MLEKVAHDEVYAFLRHTDYFNSRQPGLGKGQSITTHLDFLDGIYADIA